MWILEGVSEGVFIISSVAVVVVVVASMISEVPGGDDKAALKQTRDKQIANS